MNVDIKTFKANLGLEFLYDMDPAKVGQTITVIVFGLTTYLNETLTFEVMTSDGSMFSYIPFNALKIKNPGSLPTLDLKDLVYHNCNNLEIYCHTYEYLKGDVDCYFKNKDIWMLGEYYLTVDFYAGNDTLHIVKLENGQIAALPTHKIKFRNGTREFQPFKKLHGTWRV